MVTISNSTIRNNVYETIYDLISNAKSGFGNPALFGGYPDVKTISFPNVVINPVVVSEDTYTIETTRSGASNKNILVTIEIYSEKNKDLDTISDGLTHLLRTSNISGLSLVGVGEDFGVVFPSSSKVKQKTLTFSYLRR